MTAKPDREEFSHPALFYRSDEEYAEQTAAFVRDGLAADEPAAVAVPGRNLELIKAALGTDADGVRFLDMSQAGRNPGRIIPTVLRAFADAHPDRRVRIIGEPIWAGRSAMEYPACAQHEALINQAFAGRPATILCPYNELALDPAVLADARATHPTVITGGQEQKSGAYGWEAIVARYNEPLPPAPNALVVPFALDNLAAARRIAVEQAARMGLQAQQLMDVELAVAELMTNSVVHGGGRGTLSIWTESGQAVYEVRDRGHLADPLAGRTPAAPGQIGGRGLLLVHYVADLVRVHTTPEGTTIRLYLTL